MPGPQFRFFIKIIICQFEKELDVGIWECSLSRWNETNAGKCIEIREAKTSAVCSDNTGITLCNSLKVSPQPPRTEAQSRPWHGFNESDPGPCPGVMKQKNRYTISCVLINIWTFLLGHNKWVLIINVVTFFRKREDFHNQKQRRKKRKRFLSRRRPKTRRRGAWRSLRGRRGRSRSTSLHPQLRVRVTHTPTCRGCPRRCWTCLWTPTSRPTASATRCPTARWSGATTTTVPSSGSTSVAWTSPPSPRGSGTVPGVLRPSRRSDDREWVWCWCTTKHQYLF